jgi:hypothetical protein
MLITGPAGRFLTASGGLWTSTHLPAPSHEAPNRAQIFFPIVTRGDLDLSILRI